MRACAVAGLLLAAVRGSLSWPPLHAGRGLPLRVARPGQREARSGRARPLQARARLPALRRQGEALAGATQPSRKPCSLAALPGPVRLLSASPCTDGKRPLRAPRSSTMSSRRTFLSSRPTRFRPRPGACRTGALRRACGRCSREARRMRAPLTQRRDASTSSAGASSFASVLRERPAGAVFCRRRRRQGQGRPRRAGRAGRRPRRTEAQPVGRRRRRRRARRERAGAPVARRQAVRAVCALQGEQGHARRARRPRCGLDECIRLFTRRMPEVLDVVR